jgi:hypothetical protein
MKSVLVSVIVLLVAAIQAPGVTIYQDFTSDPGWSNIAGSASGTSYTYQAGGFMQGYVRRKKDADSVGAYYTSLGSAAIPAGTQAGQVPECWLSEDVSFGGGSAGYYGMFGLFNSNTTNVASDVTRNLLGAVTAANNATAAAWENTSAGVASVPSFPLYTGDAANTAGETYRIQMHIYDSGGATMAEMVYTKFSNIVTDPLSGALVSYTSSTVADQVLTLIAAGNQLSLGLDSFGFRNAQGGDSSAATYNYDNIYFSTTGQQYIQLPSWVPEPASMILLGLGGLFLNRRK